MLPTSVPHPADPGDRASTPRDASGLRPTRDAFAPLARATFVAAPRPPRIAPAPRVVSAPEALARLGAARAPVGVAPSAKPGCALVVACVVPGAEARLSSALRARGLRVRRLREGVPTRLVRELERALRRAAHFATVAFALGAAVGGVAVRSEALIPTWGWIPGPVIGACLGAGLLGVLGFLLGALVSVASTGRPRALVQGSILVAVEGDRLSVNEIAARVVAAGGEPIAHAAQ